MVDDIHDAEAIRTVIAEHKVAVFGADGELCDACRRTAVICHCSEKEAEAVYALLTPPRPILIAIENNDWNAELSPWYADRVFRGGDSFAGKADEYIHLLIGEIIPECEKLLPSVPKSYCIAGYSMAGLFAVYCAYKCELFDAVVSASGSLWFDGFARFARENEMKRIPRFAYFSVGLAEKNSRNTRMATVEDCMREVAEVFSDRGTSAVVEYNNGGHFSEPEKRLARGIDLSIQKLFIQE